MRSSLSLALLALGLAACGPTEREVGLSVLFALPFIALAATFFQLGYRALWFRVVEGDPAPALDRRPTIWILAISAAVWIVALASGEVGDEMLIALWLAGSSYLTYLLVAMRLSIRSQRWYARAQFAPFVLFLPVAVGLVLFGSATSEADHSLAYFILPGYLGFVPAGLFVLLVLEIAVRGHRIRARERALEPELPEARAYSLPQPTPDKPHRFVARSFHQ